MGLFTDALKNLLAGDAARRREGLAGLASRMLGGGDPVLVTHPALPAESPTVVAVPKSGDRPFAVTLTIGLGDASGRELVAVSLADPRDPRNDRIAWMLAAVAAAGTGRGSVVALPEGCLGRSSHTHAVVCAAAHGEPPGRLPVPSDGDRYPFSARDVASYEDILGATLDLVVPVTAREAAWIEAHGLDAYVEAQRAQGIAPYADRAAGETALAGG